MKFIHLSDLHLGKRVHEFSLIDDQKYILDQILSIIQSEAPDGVLIAGDVYDKAVPTIEAVDLLDSFLVRLSRMKTEVFLIAGNHDSPDRLAFGGRLMAGSGIHIAPAYTGAEPPFSLRDEFGPVNIYLLPFIKPAVVRQAFPDAEIGSWTEAVSAAVAAMNVDPAERNVLLAHQFVTNARRCDSEEMSIGGADNVDSSAFDGFDYVALGHLHGPQTVDGKAIRYCGTPLKYSFSEAKHKKSVTVVELGPKGEVDIRTVPLTPRRDMVELRGSYDRLIARDTYQNTTWQEDYVHITLTDEDSIPNAASLLQTVYHNLMWLDYDNRRTQAEGLDNPAGAAAALSPLALLEEFYEKQTGRPMDPNQSAYVEALIQTIWEGEP